MSPVGKRDPCWQYFKEEKRKNACIAVCTFCGRGYVRISLAKRHVVGGSCKDAPSDVKLAIQNCIYFKKKATKKIQSRVRKPSSKSSEMKKLLQNVKHVVAAADGDDNGLVKKRVTKKIQSEVRKPLSKSSEMKKLLQNVKHVVAAADGDDNGLVKKRVTKKIQSEVRKPLSKSSEMKKIIQNVKQVVAAADDDDDGGLVNVHGYKVKPNIAPVLEGIFAKYGDITSRSSYKTINMRTLSLEVICKLVLRLKNVTCKLVQRLQYSDLKAILSDLDSIQNELSDVETNKIEVPWLNKHLAAVREVAAVKDKLLQLKKLKANFGFVIDSAMKEKKLRLIQLLKRDMVFGALERFKDARELYLAAEKRADALEVFDKKLHDDIMECIKEYTSRKKFQDLP